MSEKKTVVVPNEEMFKPAPIPFAVVTGEGVPDYDHIKSKGKRGGMQYTATIVLDKDQEKQFRKEVLEYWEDNKPKRADDKPANWKNITRKGKDDYEGKFLVYAKTQTHFGDQQNIVPIVNQENVKLDTEEFGQIGGKSKGRLAVTLSIYGDDEDAGCSVFLSAIKLTKYEKLEPKGGATAFGKADEGEVASTGNFGNADSSAKKKDKKKKKKKD